MQARLERGELRLERHLVIALPLELLRPELERERVEARALALVKRHRDADDRGDERVHLEAVGEALRQHLAAVVAERAEDGAGDERAGHRDHQQPEKRRAPLDDRPGSQQAMAQRREDEPGERTDAAAVDDAVGHGRDERPAAHHDVQHGRPRGGAEDDDRDAAPVTADGRVRAGNVGHRDLGLMGSRRASASVASPRTRPRARPAPSRPAQSQWMRGQARSARTPARARATRRRWRRC